MNVYYNFSSWGMITPYIGGGIGASRNTMDTVHISGGGSTGTLGENTRTAFAWQASAGFGINLNPNLVLDIGYRYIDLGYAKSDTGAITISGVTVTRFDNSMNAHEASLALRYKF